MSCLRGSIVLALPVRECQSVYIARAARSASEDLQRDAVVEVQAAAGGRVAAAVAGDETGLDQRAERPLEPGGRLQAGDGAQAQHHPLGPGPLGRQLLAVELDGPGGRRGDVLARARDVPPAPRPL